MENHPPDRSGSSRAGANVVGSSFMVLCYAIIGKLIILIKFRQGQLKRAYVTENTL